MRRKMKCPHCDCEIVVTVDCDDDDDDDEEDLEFDEMGFTKRQFTGGPDD